MRSPAIPGRLSAALAAMVLLAGGTLAGSGSAAAVAGAGHPDPRAAALAHILRHGLGPAGLPGAGLPASALPGGGRDLPQPGSASMLNNVFCTSSSNCWAVGTYRPVTEADLNEVLHWNGSTWTQVAAPSPAGSADGSLSILFGVRCAAVSDCWAVGVYAVSGGADLDQALHWNGTKWSLMPTPTPGGSLSGDVNELFDVGCTSSSSCWAAGRYGTQSGGVVLLNQLLHWNGKKWSLTSVPEPGGTAAGDINALNGVRCTSVSNCLAVGSYGTTSIMLNEALHWNGTAWSQVTAPSPGGNSSDGAFSELDSVACSSATNCWAVGSYGTFAPPETFVNQALHWNGAAWSLVTTPEPAGTGSGASQELVGAACRTATNCWAVGNYTISTGAILDQALHWDGGAWSLADTPEPGGAADGDINTLGAVRCNSATDCWAAGAALMSGGPLFAQALHWNGTAWSSR